jgi:integrase
LEKAFKILSENKLHLGTERTAFLAILFYLGIRVTEALKLKPENFTVESDKLFVDVGERLKHSKQTAPLSVRLHRPFVKEIVETVKKTKPKKRVGKFSRVTAWKIVKNTKLFYPHYLRLNRITDLFQKGYTIAEVKAWTGLTLRALDFYVGSVSTRKIGENI